MCVCVCVCVCEGQDYRPAERSAAAAAMNKRMSVAKTRAIVDRSRRLVASIAGGRGEKNRGERVLCVCVCACV